MTGAVEADLAGEALTSLAWGRSCQHRRDPWGSLADFGLGRVRCLGSSSALSLLRGLFADA